MTMPESSSATATQNVDARARTLSLINANWTTQEVSVATQLRLPELLRETANCRHTGAGYTLPRAVARSTAASPD